MAAPLIVAPLLPLTLAYWLAARARYRRPQKVRRCGVGGTERLQGGGGLWAVVSRMACTHGCCNHPPTLAQTLALYDAIRLDREQRRAEVAGRAGPGAGSQGRKAEASQVVQACRLLDACTREVRRLDPPPAPARPSHASLPASQLYLSPALKLSEAELAGLVAEADAVLHWLDGGGRGGGGGAELEVRAQLQGTHPRWRPCSAGDVCRPTCSRSPTAHPVFPTQPARLSRRAPPPPWTWMQPPT